MRRLALTLFAAALAAPAAAQFQLQDSTTTADLRGIASVGNGVAWASGSHGTVLRTEDGGFVWQGCATPPGAEQLDFRGIQAFDAQTALIMSSGKGPLSRIYKTTDGCRTWTLTFTNPDPDGFFDAIASEAWRRAFLIGDPVAEQVSNLCINARGCFGLEPVRRGQFYEHFKCDLPPSQGEALFAASNFGTPRRSGVPHSLR